MVTRMPKTKGRSPPPSAGCPTSEVDVALLTPSSSPARQTRHYIFSEQPLRRMSPPERSMSECSSASSATSTPTSSSPNSMKNITTRRHRKHSSTSRKSTTPSFFSLFSLPRRRRLAWFCKIWIAILTFTYLNLALQYKDQRITHHDIKSTTLRPQAPPLQVELLLRGTSDTTRTVSKDQQYDSWNTTVTKSWRDLYARDGARNDTTNDTRIHPRVFPSSLSSPKNEKFSHHQDNERKTASFQNEMGAPKPPPSSKKIRHRPTHKPHCVPKAEWHSFNFLNCNSFHEIDFVSGLVREKGSSSSLEYQFRGGTRETWLLETSAAEEERQSTTTTSRVILKTLRWMKSYDEIRFDHQRIDALALERLTGSRHVVQPYGFCGMSALNEFAEVGHFGRYFAIRHANITSGELLAYARDAALGLADVHEIDVRSGSSNSTSNFTATLVHHDFSPKNLLLATDNKIKISDFNDGQLLRWDYSKNMRCKGFDWDGLCGTTVERTNRRAPEECGGVRQRYGTTERTEVYHLGTIFHFMLSKEQFPYRFEERTLNGTIYQPGPKQVKRMILNGQQPPLPPEIEESKDPAIQAIVRAMRKAFTFDPKQRPSAREIARLLDEGGASAEIINAPLVEGLHEPSNRPNRNSIAANDHADGSKQERRDLQDRLHVNKEIPDPPDDVTSGQEIKPKGGNNNKRTSVFALNDENLNAFDPYSSVEA